MTTFLLKLIALFFMIIDHIGAYFIKNEELNTLFRLFGRISAPLFFFLFTVGFIKTKNREKYGRRLFLSAIIMYIGNTILYYIFNIDISANILITLSLGFLFLQNLELNKNNKIKCILAGTIICTLFYFVEYSYLALLCIITFYFYNKATENFSKNKCNMFLLIIYSLISIIYPFVTKNYIQSFMILSILPILYYNGKQGKNNKFIKNFYYVFYILHIWIFEIISYIGG